MAKRIPKADTDQRRLALSRDQRLDVLVRVDPEQVGVGRRQWRNVMELLRQIEFCGGSRDNSLARVCVLAARMGTSERTVQRAAAVAIEAGLLVREDRVNEYGQGSNRWLVQWDRLVAKVPPDQLSPPGDQLSPPGDQLSPPPDKLSPPIENQPRSDKESTRKVDPDPEAGSQTTTGSRTESTVCFDQAVATAQQVAAKLSLRPARDDWSLLVKAAALSQRYGEAWLWDAVEGVRVVRPRRPMAYLWACLEEGANQRRRRMRRDLARLELPIAALAQRVVAAREVPA